MTRHDAYLITARPAAMPAQGCRRFAARGPRLPRWLRQPRHGGGACWRRNTLGSAPRPKKSWVALLDCERGLDLADDAAVRLAPARRLERTARASDASERPCRVSADERLGVVERADQRRHRIGVAAVAERDGDVPQETAPLRA